MKTTKKWLDLSYKEQLEFDDILTKMVDTILESQEKLQVLGFSKEDAIAIVKNKLIIF